MTKEGHEFGLYDWKCPICRTKDHAFIGYRGGAYHRYQYGIQSTIVQCQCGLMYPDPFPIPKSPQEIYGDPAKYFSNHNEQRKIERDRKVIRQARKYLGRTVENVLDVGSGKGECLAAATAEGVRSVGLEFSDAMIKYAKDTYGVTVLKQSIEEHAESKDNKYDLVLLNAILEHVYDPRSMIESCSMLLKKSGLLYIDIPNEPSLVTFVGNAYERFRGSKQVYNLSPTWSPYHVYGFNPKSLATLLGQFGLKILSLRKRSVPKVRSSQSLEDRIKSFMVEQAMKVANWTGTASNMFIWSQLKGR